MLIFNLSCLIFQYLMNGSVAVPDPRLAGVDAVTAVEL